VNQQTESMTEKFFERVLFPRLFQLNCGKSRVRGLGAKHPKNEQKKSQKKLNKDTKSLIIKDIYLIYK
jgi:hypothetical protein